MTVEGSAACAAACTAVWHGVSRRCVPAGLRRARVRLVQHASPHAEHLQLQRAPPHEAGVRKQLPRAHRRRRAHRPGVPRRRSEHVPPARHRGARALALRRKRRLSSRAARSRGCRLVFSPPSPSRRPRSPRKTSGARAAATTTSAKTDCCAPRTGCPRGSPGRRRPSAKMRRVASFDAASCRSGRSPRPRPRPRPPRRPCPPHCC